MEKREGSCNYFQYNPTTKEAACCIRGTQDDAARDDKSDIYQIIAPISDYVIKFAKKQCGKDPVGTTISQGELDEFKTITTLKKCAELVRQKDKTYFQFSETSATEKCKVCFVGAGGEFDDKWNVYEMNHRVKVRVKSNGLPNHCFRSPDFAPAP